MKKNSRKHVETYYREQAERIAGEYWGVELTCPIVFVNREWKRRNASFHFNRETKECEIRMNHRRHEELGFDGYLPVLKHELVHWYLWSIGEPFDDDDEEFIRECMRIGANISGTKKAQEALKAYEAKERMYG